jgi:SpoIIAA-like
MIKTEVISANALKITAPEKLRSDDFRELAPQIDALMNQHGTIRLLIDASRLDGWENLAAFESHLEFVRSHQHKVERIAVILGHEWQHWLVAAFKMFLHPSIRAYEKNQEGEALQWIVQ